MIEHPSSPQAFKNSKDSLKKQLLNDLTSCRQQISLGGLPFSASDFAPFEKNSAKSRVFEPQKYDEQSGSGMDLALSLLMASSDINREDHWLWCIKKMKISCIMKRIPKKEEKSATNILCVEPEKSELFWSFFSTFSP